MLVWLAEHLVKYYSGFNVFSYLTFRAIVSLLTALFNSPLARLYVTMARNLTLVSAVRRPWAGS